MCSSAGKSSAHTAHTPPLSRALVQFNWVILTRDNSSGPLVILSWHSLRISSQQKKIGILVPSWQIIIIMACLSRHNCFLLKQAVLSGALIPAQPIAWESKVLSPLSRALVQSIWSSYYYQQASCLACMGEGRMHSMHLVGLGWVQLSIDVRQVITRAKLKFFTTVHARRTTE